MLILASKTHNPSTLVIPAFHRAVVPAQAVPKLGKMLHVNCPHGYGRIGVLDSEFLDADTLRTVNYLDGAVVLFAAEFVVQKFRNCGCGGCEDHYSGFLKGHQLLSPVPPHNHAAWKEVRYIGGHNKVQPRFIDTVNADPVVRADIAVLRIEDVPDLNNPGEVLDRRCKCYVITDASKL